MIPKKEDKLLIITPNSINQEEHNKKKHKNKLEIFYSSLLLTRKIDFDSIDSILEHEDYKNFYSWRQLANLFINTNTVP